MTSVVLIWTLKWFYENCVYVWPTNKVVLWHFLPLKVTWVKTTKLFSCISLFLLYCPRSLNGNCIHNFPSKLSSSNHTWYAWYIQMLNIFVFAFFFFWFLFFFFQAVVGIRYKIYYLTGVQTCALPIFFIIN